MYICICVYIYAYTYHCYVYMCYHTVYSNSCVCAFLDFGDKRIVLLVFYLENTYIFI